MHHDPILLIVVLAAIITLVISLNRDARRPN
jgi:hypothetical protein